MGEPPRRKRFQIHLSTAIVMMFVAGGLLWANVVPSRSADYLIDYSTDGICGYTRDEYGWPSKVMEKTDWDAEYYRRERWQDIFGHKKIQKGTRFLPYLGFVINILIALFLLLATYFLCEWQIRWRTARKRA